MFDSIAASSASDYVKAEMDLLAGQLYLDLGQTDAAYQRFLHTVENYPGSYDSYSALVALVNAGIPVSDLDRGLVDYFAGQYGYALDAFNRYLDSGAPGDGTADYYAAMTLREMGQYQQAVEAFSRFISAYPANQYWPAAWDEKAYIQWYFLGDYTAAIETLLAYTRQAQVAGTIPQTMLTIGRLYERNGQFEEAARMWEDLNNAYPGSEVADQALFWAGITRYRMGQYDQALITFQRSILLSVLPADQARAYFWAGKAQQVLGDGASAQESWLLAAALDATDFYSLRAQDKLFNRGIFEAVPRLDPQVDLDAERREAEAWLRVTFSLPSDTALNGIGALGSDARFVRGTELWQFGLYDEARQEFEHLRLAVSSDPAESYRLGNALIELGLYRPGITALRQVLTLAGMDTQLDTLAAPAYFNHMRYGFYYPELVPAAASQGGLEQLFLYSVIRQESLYEGFATSYAGARGLMQIMPATGQDLADSLGWPPGYTASDLYRPLINVNLGTTYLVNNRGRFNGDLFATLAAYHAGPGSSEIWLGLSGDDPDLFVELVRFEDTRNYIRSIYEIYWMYRLNYEQVP
jgi:soluble lytic murein transglycosylase